MSEFKVTLGLECTKEKKAALGSTGDFPRLGTGIFIFPESRLEFPSWIGDALQTCMDGQGHIA